MPPLNTQISVDEFRERYLKPLAEDFARRHDEWWDAEWRRVMGDDWVDALISKGAANAGRQ
jgi:hypothetical protein